MPDASPAKWHLAHTTWPFRNNRFFRAQSARLLRLDPAFTFLFNSYYETIGARQPRPKRGMITRPTLDVIYAYREHVDAAMMSLLQYDPTPAIAGLIELGCHHEQQHQELFLTDILHLFAQNPLRPTTGIQARRQSTRSTRRPRYKTVDGGIVEIGHDGRGFAFDSEGPRHRVLIEPFQLADRLVTNSECMEFMADDGYRNPLLWLSEGWERANAEGWTMPLYWERRDGEHWSMTLRGAQPVDLAAPVTHVSYFEAWAFATWAGRRLPTEFERKHAARGEPLQGNFADSGRLRPKAAPPGEGGLRQIYGDVWEWTCSAFSPYPRFRPVDGAVGEYNGKFMSGQFVLRGGSCVTPAGHLRRSYRNFFPPNARWQFSGLRLAGDA